MTATTEPVRVTAGDTVSWLKTLSDYPASAGWVLTYTLINSATKITLTSTAQGDDHLVSASASTTATWTAGSYTWVVAVAKDGERYTLAQGSIVVAPNLAAATTHDTRTSARKALDAVNTLLENYGSKAYLQGYEINGRRMQFQTPGEFLAFRSKLQAQVKQEENMARIASGLSPRNQVAVRFNR